MPSVTITNPGFAVERWVNDMFNMGYVQGVTASMGLGVFTLHITVHPSDEQWFHDNLAKAQRGMGAGDPPPSLSVQYVVPPVMVPGGLQVPVWPDAKVGFDVPMTAEGTLDRRKLQPPKLAYRRRNVHVLAEPGDLFALAQDAFSIYKRTDQSGGAMDFIIYTYDPTEAALKFRTMTIQGYGSLTDALVEATKQMDDMGERGVQREAVAWEVLKDAKDLPSSFSATEKRVREIMGAHGRVDSGGMFGVLDFPLMRRMQAMPDKAPLKEVCIPYEAHMPAHKKANPDDCMAAVRAICANGAHDPNKKFH